MRIQRQLINWVVLGASSISAQAAIPAVSPNLGSIEAGKVAYGQHCSACHGVNGDGTGSASVWLFPRPRNFSAGLFKIKSTPGTALPTDEDLFNTVTRGMPGSSMPSFTYLSEQERRDAVQYIKTLATFTDASGKRVNRFEQARENGPPVTVQSLAQGTRLFSKLNCVLCHGETGAGDGPNPLGIPALDCGTRSLRTVLRNLPG